MAEPARHPSAATSVAVIGLACRFPDADDPPTLLDTVLTRRRAFRRLPPGRLDLADCASQAPGSEGRQDTIASSRAGLIEGWQFDRDAFRIPAAAYAAGDPAHWLALETAARALAAAGFPGGTGLDKDRIGVVIGNALTGDTTRAQALRLRWPYVRRVLAESLRAGEVRSDLARKVLRHAAARYRAPFPRPGEYTLAGSLPAAIPAGICSYFGFRGGSQAVDGACASALQAVTSACAALAARDLDVALAGGVDISLDPLELIGLAAAGPAAAGEVRIYDENPTGYLPGEGCGVVVLMRTAQARAAGLPVFAEIIGWGTSAGGQPGVVASAASSQLLALRRAYDRAGVDPREVRLIEGQGSGTAAGDDAELIALSELRAGAREPAALGSIKANIGHARAAAGAAGLIKTVLAVGTGVIPPTTGVASPHPLLRDAGSGLWLPEVAEEWPAGSRLAGVSAMGSGGVNVHVVLRGGTPARGSRYDRMLRVLPRLAGAGSGRRDQAASRERTPDQSRRTLPYLLHAADRQQLDAALARLEKVAGWLSDAELTDLACQLGRDGRTQGPVRVALVASHQEELARLAGHARELLPGLSGGLLSSRPGVFAADSADGRVTLLLSDEAGESAAAGIDGSLAALRWLDSLEVGATAAVGHGLGEIAGLAWAGVLSQAEVAEVAALRAEFLSGPAVRILGPAGQHASGSYDPLPVDPEPLELLRTAIAQFRFGPPRRRLISTTTGRELASAAEVADLICCGFTGPDRLGEAVAAGAEGATLLIETGPGQLLASTAARTCRVPTVSLDAPAPGSGRALAAAALFAAGAIGEVAPLFAGYQSRPFDLRRDQVFITSPGQVTAPPPAPGPAQTFPAQTSPAQTSPAQTSPAQTSPDQTSPDRTAAAVLAEVIETAAGSGMARRTPAAAAAPGVPEQIAPERPEQAALRAPRRTVRDAAPEAAPVSTGPGGGQFDALAGVATWARCFTEEAGPAVPPGDISDDRPWRILIGNGDPLGPETAATFASDPAASRTLAVIGDPAAAGAAQTALHAAQEALRTGHLVVITASAWLTGFLASLHAERPSLGVTVLRVPPGPGAVQAARRHASTRPGEFCELVISADGTARRPAAAVRDVPGGGDFPLGAGDVVVVSRASGGAALALAQVLACSGAAVAVVGQAGPEPDSAVVAGLEELRLAGAHIAYEVVDTEHPADMAMAVQRIERRLGPVTAVAHAAGGCPPVPMAAMTDRILADHLAAAHGALRDLLRPVAARRLRLILTFGSLAGRYGLPRQGLLALASTGLARQAAAVAGEITGCRAIHVDLPGWSGSGLGEGPGLAVSLAESGTAALSVADVSRLLLKVLTTTGLPAAVALHGRAGGPAARLTDLSGPALAGRFLRDVRVHYPGIELIGDTQLSLTADPYLADYRVDGLPVLPPAMALEALAQAASALAGQPLRRAEAVTMDAPVVLPADGGPALIRVCALAEGGKITAALRCADSGLQADHLRAEFPWGPRAISAARTLAGAAAAGRAGRGGPGSQPDALGGTSETGIVDGAEIYGPVCFQSGRFRRIAILSEITARSCRALARGAEGQPYFPGEPSSELLLGSPGLNDTALQVLQACTPHRRVWLAGCESVTFGGQLTDGAVTILATAEPLQPPAAPVPAPAPSQDEPVAPAPRRLSWTIAALDSAGRLLVTWQGVRLREAGLMPRNSAWPPTLLSVYLERGAAGVGLDPDMRVTVSCGTPAIPAPRAATPAAGSRAETAGAAVTGTGQLAGFALTARGARHAACGWAVADPQRPVWPGAGALAATFSRLCSHLSEPPAASAARLQAVAACLVMAQAPAGAPVTFRRVTADGWAVLEAAGIPVACTVVRISGVSSPVAIALATGQPRRDGRPGDDQSAGRGSHQLPAHGR